MLKTFLASITQLILASPIILSLLRTFMLLGSGNPGTFNSLFIGFIVNLVLLGAILISLILIIAQNKNLSKKAIILHILSGLIVLGLHFGSAFVIAEMYKNGNL